MFPDPRPVKLLLLFDKAVVVAAVLIVVVVVIYKIYSMISRCETTPYKS